MRTFSDTVTTYYDTHVSGKLHDFVEGNERVDRACQTIEQWSVTNPRRILEVGCGIGHVCWRMAQRWPMAEVVGLDISPKSLEIARNLFGSSTISFVEGPLTRSTVAGKFDLIVLMDVYEHVKAADRPALHEALRELRNDGGRIVLSVPTPRHLAWLRQHEPVQIQPIDEDVSVETLLALARDTATNVLLYQEVGVWHEGDYAHATLGNWQGWIATANTDLLNDGIKARIRRLVLGSAKAPVPSRSERLALVRRQLGPEFYIE